MAFAFSLPLRIAQGLLAVIILGLTAYGELQSLYISQEFVELTYSHAVVNDWAYWSWAPSSENFLLFCSVWTILAVAYLIIAPLHFPTAAHKFGILAAEFLTMLFWFAGFIAVAVLLTDIGCSRYWGVCRASEAAVVFAAFEWYVLFNIQAKR
jgi:hypothetical protein